MTGRPSSVTSSVARFGSAGLVAVVALGALVLVAVSRISTTEALRSARERASLAGSGIVEPALGAGLLEVTSPSDPAVRALDEIVRTRVMTERIVRVKIWSPQGRIVYSDEPRLVGRQFEPKPDHAEVLRSGAISSEISHTDAPENRFERESGRLLEVYLPLRTADGHQVVYEQYERYDSVVGNSRRLLRQLALPFGLGLGLLWLTQLPLARSLARRVRAAELEQRRLLEHAVTASERERERIAADLHDGVVQDLAGLTYELAAAAKEAPDGAARATLLHSEEIARRSMRRVRSSLVDLHPQQVVHAVGLAAALEELAEPLRRADVTVGIDVADGVGDVDREVTSLVYRVAQELLRNTAKHAGATRISVTVGVLGDHVRMEVADDGRGFSRDDRATQQRQGHLGLELQEALVRRAGGTIDIRSAPGAGTAVVVRVPR